MPSVNVGGDLCGVHLTELKEFSRQQEEKRIEEIRKTHYYIPDNTEVGEGDGPVWSNYVVYEAIGKTINEFLENVSISEVDQDGGEADTISFWDAPSKVQDCILDLANIKWDDTIQENANEKKMG